MHGLAAGDRVEMTQPLQNFPLGVGAARYVLVAGGIGITALLSMATVLRERGADYTLVYVGRSRAVMPYLDQLADEHGERFHLHVDDEGTPLDVEKLVDGVVGHEAAQRTEMYVCGPIRLMDALRRSWIDHGLPGAEPALRDLRQQRRLGRPRTSWCASRGWTARCASTPSSRCSTPSRTPASR